MKTLDEGSFKSDGDNVVICVGQSIATIKQIDLLRIALERIGASGKALEEQLKDVDYRGRLIDGDELYRTIYHSETISKEDVLDKNQGRCASPQF